MNFEVIPNDRIGPVKLGMHRSDVREVLSSRFGEVPNENTFNFRQDVFFDLGTQVYYKSNFPHACVAIMVEHPVKPIFQGIDLLSGNIVEIATLLKSIEPQIEAAWDGILSHKFKIFISADYPEHYDGDIEDDDKRVPNGVMIFREPFRIEL